MNRILKPLLLSLMLSAGIALNAQVISITGTVKDASGEAIIGATVQETGTSNGTVTDIDGNFAIQADAQATLNVKYIGYEPQDIPVGGRTAIHIVLEEDAISLGEVVAIGYGSQKKKEVTGSVASIKSEDFNAGVKTNPMGLLQGKVAGLNVIKTSSDPTSTGYNIQIRGFSTLDKGAGTSPLYIVDGVPVSNIDNISPDEIASMDVLKDGSAAAIYGTRGTNGVIIITTKRGEGFSDTPATQVEYAGYMSVSVRNGDLGMSTAEEYRQLSELTGGRITPVIYADAEGNDNYNSDFISELCRPMALAHNHNLAISGSNRNLNYRASVNYKNAEGIAKVSNREEVNSKLSAQQKALDGWLDLQYDLNYMHYRNDYNCGDFEQAATLNPTYPIYDASTATGYFYPQGTGTLNPVEDMNQKESYKDGNFFRGSVKATLNIKPVEGLKMSAFGAIEEGDNYNYWYNKTLNTDETSSGKAGREGDKSFNKLFEATADYVHGWGDHRLVLVGGFSYQNFFYDGYTISNKGFPTDDAKYYQIGNGDASKQYLNTSSYRNSNTLAAGFFRANYNFDEKYLLSASIRREGSSRFGANHKWGWFPAVSAGWRLGKEDFIQSIGWVDDLKLRVGFGVTGNNLASDLKSVAMLSNGGSFWYNNQYVYTYTVNQNVNEDLRWEKKYEYNFGIDYDLLDKRLYGSIDLYYRNTKDLLWDYEVPTPPYQYSTLLANAGEMASYGLEIALNGVVVRNKDWNFVTSPTIAFNKNYITKLSDASKGFNYTQTTSGGVGENGIMNTNTQVLIEGEPVGAFYGYKFLGFKSDGTWMYSTPQGGIVSSENATDAHRQVIGNAQPLFTYGWNNTVRFRQWDATVFLRGVYGNDVLNITRWAYGPQSSVSSAVYMADVTGSDVVMANKSNFSDYYLEDGSYLKLDNLTIGYTVPVKKENKIVNSARIYATGQNLLTLTKYSGQDPEVNTTDVWSSGIDYCDFYPTVATFLVGVNITFN